MCPENVPDYWYTERMKLYPASGCWEIMRANQAIFHDKTAAAGKDPGSLDSAPEAAPDKTSDLGEEVRRWELEQYREDRRNRPEAVERSQRRARQRVRDIALSNRFAYFVTLTFDPKKIDRYDIRDILHRVNRWLDNRVRRNGLKYVLVPEHHKDGAIHFHGFFSGEIAATDSGHKDKRGNKVYNIPDWDFGFTTAIEPYGDYGAAVAYVCKYISKQQTKIGGRWYYSGGALDKPIYVYDGIPEKTEAEPYTFRVGECCIECTIERGKIDELGS